MLWEQGCPLPPALIKDDEGERHGGSVWDMGRAGGSALSGGLGDIDLSWGCPCVISCPTISGHQ